MTFKCLESMFPFVADGIRPPERLSVSEAAEKFRVLHNPGSYIGPWKNEVTPYLVEFMNVLTSEDYRGAVFVGPAQSGKSDCVLNWATHTAVCDPMDMMIVEKTQTAARELSITKLAKWRERSPEVKKRVLPGRHNQNIFDVRFKAGTIIMLTWPTKNNLSGKSVPRIWMADYDRMPMNVDGEGAPFWLAQKRTTTFGRFGMTVAESSPSFPVDLKRWVQRTKHEAPPSEGILSLYNAGDRRRWMWRCVSCGNAFEPDIQTLRWNDSTDDISEAAADAHLECPVCQAKYYDGDTDLPGKHQMNLEHARWIKDGQVWRSDGEVAGEPIQSDIASFWLKGPAAAFMPLTKIVFDYLTAKRTYDETGEDQDLKTVTNTTLGIPYVPPADQIARSPEELRQRARDFGIRVVPQGVRFLVASIDLQKNRFVVQVHGVGSGEHGDPDWWIIDRFDIKKSRRFDESGERWWVNLAAHPEDWRQLTDEVILRTYPLADGSGRHMAIKAVASDAAGTKGFTEAAYRFWRWLRYGDENDILDENGNPVYVWEPNLTARFHLVRGKATGPRVKLTFPDSMRRDKYSGARGDVPVWELNTQVLKDGVDAMLARKERGGRVNFPEWLPQSFYRELCVEVKDQKKGWHNPKGYRNESWDLMVYAKALTLMPDINIETIDWDNPPPWADEWDRNDLVIDPRLQDHPDRDTNEEMSLSKLAETLG